MSAVNSTTYVDLSPKKENRAPEGKYTIRCEKENTGLRLTIEFPTEKAQQIFQNTTEFLRGHFDTAKFDKSSARFEISQEKNNEKIEMIEKLTAQSLSSFLKREIHLNPKETLTVTVPAEAARGA